MGVQDGRSEPPVAWRPSLPIGAQGAVRAAAQIWRQSGSATAARRMAQGMWFHDGVLVETAPGAAPWPHAPGTPAWNAYLHSQAWLDDFAALSRSEPGWAALRLVHDWIEDFGHGTARGPAWEIQTTARRQIHWLAHRDMLAEAATPREKAAFEAVLHRQRRHIALWWWRALRGLPRLETLAAMLFSRLEMRGYGSVKTVIRRLGREAFHVLGDLDAVVGRNPERLMRLVDLLSLMEEALRERGYTADTRHLAALGHLAPMLGALTHSDGRLGRFHGAPAGKAGDAEAVLARLERPEELPRLALGCARLTSGDASLLMDASAGGDFASALAIEFVAGAHPILVNAGGGASFGPDAIAEARRTRSHSTVVIGGESHALNPAGDPARLIRIGFDRDAAANWLVGDSDAWRKSHGLAHRRRLRLAHDGRFLEGEDVFKAATDADCRLFDQARGSHYRAVDYQIRFLLHPDVRYRTTKRWDEVFLRLPDDSIWRLRVKGGSLSLRPGLYYDSARLHPLSTKTVVASGEIVEYGSRITWSLEAQSAL
ncbi:MAG: heparinase II/III family protein [Pseudomonadota bacterium]